ncbi:hypothetical protein GGR88_002437 [Sphingomonas jejuensis]|uniref:Deferrochelatase/peroxidase EfeB n=1 Tax=Sphingomonas jejuensis TaxID=904715 RepID=A0ABX0XNG3_9SPHN|nr:isopropylmalate isomerase [Sphingomonas jejuensis]NJC34923.1 hypothetical protein [Sphingomonas jejuensis]
MAEDNSKRDQDAQRRKALTAAGIGVGLGIGSAALAAALLYGRGGSRRKDDHPPRTSTAPKTPVQEGNRWTD